MSDMIPSGSKYTDVQRKEACIQCAITGVMSVVSRDMNIPEATLSEWKNHSDWWDGIFEEVRSAKADEHIARYTQLVDEGQRIALEKLPEASARDAMIISATATDKARLLMNMPTSISGKSSDLTALAERFKAIEASHRAIQSTVVDEQ